MTKVYELEKIRNIALLGHSGAGKTSLAEAMLFNSGATTRLGRVEEGNTASDYDEEEIKRTISINMSVVPTEWQDHKINIIDTPGYLDFVGEVISGLNAVETAVLVLDGVSGVEVGTLLAWKYIEEQKLPSVVFINKMGRENASYRRSLDALRGKFDATFVPMQIPIRKGESFEGLVNLMTMTAHAGPDATDIAIPENMADEIEEFRTEMIEAAAETDDELMMKYFDGEALTQEEIAQGINNGIKAGNLIPVFCGSATGNIGVRSFMNEILEIVPAPYGDSVAQDGEETLSIKMDPTGPTIANVFKTVDDQYGSVSYFKVVSGVVKADSRLYNVNSHNEERLGQIFLPRGKDQLSVNSVTAGDIGAVVKLSSTKTFDTLAAKGTSLTIVPPTNPNPLYAVALQPQSQSDTGKMGPVTQRMVATDPTLQARHDPVTREFLIEGMGETHINVVVNRMANKYGLNVDTTIPKVPYQETVTKSANARYRHKKQTGGAGQFAEVELRVEPLPRGEKFEFTSEVFGGAISSVFFPSIEKGIKQVMEQGVLAGSPVVDVKAVVIDGKEHPVDSKDIAFQIAGREVFKQAFMNAGAVLLEPIMELAITIPDDYTGDVMGDLTTKRGQVQGMEQVKGNTVITALAPLAEIQRYATSLRSITQGRGLYEQKLSHYANVPSHLTQDIIDQRKKEEEESK